MKKALFLVVLLLIPPGLYAQDDTANLGSIVVGEEGYTYGINDYGRATAVFNAGALEGNSAANVADLASSVPGVYFSKSGLIDATVGSFSASVFKIRGLGEMPNSGVLTLIDDRPQSMSVFRHQLLDTLALDNTESLEIIKGPSAVEYGNQAVAGVINIKTKQMKKEGSSTLFSAAAGNYFTQDYYLSNMSKIGAYDYGLSAGYKATQGARQNSESYQQNYSAKIGYAYSQEIRFGGSAGYDDILFYNPGPVTAATWDREQEACRLKHVAGDVRVENTNIDFKGKIILYAETGSNDFLKSTSPAGNTIPGTYIDYTNFGVRFMEEWNLIPGNVIKIGFDWQNFGGHFINYPPMAPMKRDVTASENDYAPYVVLAQKVGITSIMLGLRYGFNTKWGQDLIPQAGATLSLLEGHKIYANVSKGYRTPAMGTVIFANYGELAPEDFWQYEAGFEHEIMNTFMYTASVYQIEAQNLLKTDPVDMKLKNSGFAMVRGVEAGAELKLFNSYKIGASGAYNEPGDASAHTAMLTGKSYISVSLEKLVEIRVETEHGINRYDKDKKLDKLQDYMLVNAGIKYNTFFSEITGSFYVDVNNIMDVKYDVKKGYPAPGFIIKGGVLLKI